MPFRLINAPTTFQAVMHDLFHHHLRRFVLVFFDAILVYNRNWEEHLKQLWVVFELLCRNQFHVNQKKYSIGKSILDYLGHVIFVKGVEMDPRKILEIILWPTPKSIKAVRGFLEITGYY